MDLVKYYHKHTHVYFYYVPGSEKTIQEEYGSSVAPDIDAADTEVGTPNIVYLVNGKYLVNRYRHKCTSI